MDSRLQARRWLLTINNPNITDDEMIKYINDLEHIKYCIFQREKGHETGTEHFQLFIVFSIGKRFETIKKYFPTAHIEKAEGSNIQCRDYCSKSDTRVSGPFEIGNFSEERARNDIKQFYELLDTGVSDIEIRDLYPRLFLKEFNKLNELRSMRKSEIFKRQERDLEVTYIYGPSGSGKTTYVRDLVRGKDYFCVDTFDNSAFTGYLGEDILIIDEFKGSGQFSLQYMNRLLDCVPFKVRGLRYLGYACFTKVYIISNFHYSELYKHEQEESKAQFEGFVRRLNNIIRISKGNLFIEKQTIFEDLPIKDVKPFGRKKCISQIIEYNSFGVGRIVFDKNNPLLVEFDSNDLPF